VANQQFCEGANKHGVVRSERPTVESVVLDSKHMSFLVSHEIWEASQWIQGRALAI